MTTKRSNAEEAVRVACEAYDRARFLQAENLPIATKRFDAVAKLAVTEMESLLSAGTGKSVYRTYVTAINKYLSPFFGKHNINNITPDVMKKFEAWRVKKMGKVPVASTMTNHLCAMNRVYDVAISRGWISKVDVPKMSSKGAKSVARPPFNEDEWNRLSHYMPSWIDKGHTAKTREMRELLRDYVLILANTGMRHGTEAESIRWKHIEWIKQGNDRYLQIMVNGKKGPRTLIARHNTEDYLKRIQSRFADLAKYKFDDLLKAKLDVQLFRLRSGATTKCLNGTFRTLVRDCGLEKDPTGELNRTLYSLRHTYATFALVKDKMSIHTLAKQMGTSTAMIEKHYSHLTPAMNAKAIAGPKYGKKRQIQRSRNLT